MHPSLDRPHPDCNDEIVALKECHLDMYKKYTGGCNDIKVSLDNCLKKEKKRLLLKMNENLPEEKSDFEDVVKVAFGREMTFSEYLAKDKEYLAAKNNKK